MKKTCFIALFFLTNVLMQTLAQEKINLSGQWSFALDSTDVGVNEGWYARTFDESITLPGTTDDARKGVPNQLTPQLQKPQVLHLTRNYSYVGVAWYKREIVIPSSMAGKPLMLEFERVMWESRLWVDGKEMTAAQETESSQTQELKGSNSKKQNNSLTTPHRYELPDGLSAGTHILTLRIDNQKLYDISVNNLAHAYTNDTQIMWNGVLGKMELTALPTIYIHNIAVYPLVAEKKIRVKANIEYRGKKSTKVTLQTQAVHTQTFIEKLLTKTVLNIGRQTIEYDYPMGDDVKLWDEFNPELYTLSVTCQKGKETATKATSFGMREVKGEQGFLSVNGNRVFLRGTLECCIFPLTGTPPMTTDGWEKVFSAAKEWGLNHLRFHSWCPPEAAFQVADRMGFYVQVELPNWSLTIGQDEGTSRFLYDEFGRIVREYGNHPSFCLMSVGNELQPDFNFLNGMVKHMKNADNRRLYTTTSFTFEKGHGGHPEPEDEFFITQWTDDGWVRGQGVFDQEPPCFNKDYSAATQGISIPLISHEIGQYAVYPNLKEIDKYTGVLNPLNFKAVKQDLQQKGLYDKADLFLQASGKLAVRLYKEEIERAMKTPNFSGFQLLDLHDFPGQGTALVGLLDAFWDSKGLTDASYFRQFCAPVVPLARFAKATYSGNESFAASVEVANYSGQDISKGHVVWTLTDGQGHRIAEGKLTDTTLYKGRINQLGQITADLKAVKQADRLTLDIRIEGTQWRNNWSVWVYPVLESIDQGNVMITQDVAEALTALKQGRKVLLSPRIDHLKGLEGKFLPVFWSPVHFPKQAGTMGLLCNPQHAALRHFPTDMHSDWQWWHLVKRSKVLVVDSIPVIQPIVEAVDNFANNRRLVSIFEARCGEGRLVFSAMDLLSACSDKPEIQQMRYSLLQYMNSKDFAPTVQIGEADILSLIDEQQTEVKTDATSIYK
ncbi:MAG: glycoside hydrolase family 2 TIM barrel-domain containing protein [Prevotellaceae bacterium]|nr:glycoside hydrolase family 2 TIM barrel-domain containing protein [Prevotellaceae bacterium]